MIARVRGHAQRMRLRRALAPRSNVPLERLGSSYGGWVIPSDLVDRESIVYSGGVGEDVSFDLALIARTGCTVWAFDPTPRSIEFARHIGEPRFHFLPFGLWSSDCTQRFYAGPEAGHVSHSAVARVDDRPFFEAECLSLTTAMRDLGHERIDLLKLDIEGAELEVLASLETEPDCICVELHPVRELHEIVGLVKALPYDVLHVEGWNVTLAHR